MPGRIKYNGINIDFQNEWARFDPLLLSKANVVRSASGIAEHLKQFEQEFISTQIRFSPGQDEIQLQRFFEYANDGSTFELWRDKNLGAYISFEGGGNSATVPTITPRGLLTNDKVAGTFTRADTADSSWYLDPSTGLMTVVPTTANIPRFEAGKYGQHAIRIDGAAANLITDPSDFGTNWVQASQTLDANTSETLDPNGGSTADKLIATAGNGLSRFTTSTASGNNVTLAGWVKCPSGTVGASLVIDDTVSGTDNTGITVTTEWQRVSFTADTSGFGGNLRFSINITDNTDIIYVWGFCAFDSAQFDLGTVGALSSAAVTRGAERLTFASANTVNKEKMSFACWIKPRWAFDGQDATSVLFRSGVSDANAHMDLIINTNGDINVGMYRSASSTRINVTVAGSFLIQDSWDNHLGFTIDSTISNGIKIYHNGLLKATSSNSAVNISEVGTPFSFGSDLNGTANINATIDEGIIMKDIKPESWFQQGYSRRFALGEGRNYWSSVRLANLNYVRQALRGGRSTIPLEFEEVIS